MWIYVQRTPVQSKMVLTSQNSWLRLQHLSWVLKNEADFTWQEAMGKAFQKQIATCLKATKPNPSRAGTALSIVECCGPLDARKEWPPLSQRAWISLCKRWEVTESLADEQRIVVFSKEEDGRDRKGEESNTYWVPPMCQGLCWMLYLSYFFKFASGYTSQMRELPFKKTDISVRQSNMCGGTLCFPLWGGLKGQHGLQESLGHCG